jgi:hypothetical protein
LLHVCSVISDALQITASVVYLLAARLNVPAQSHEQRASPALLSAFEVVAAALARHLNTGWSGHGALRNSLIGMSA